MSKKIKILVADDEESLRSLLKAIVKSENEYSLTEAVDGDDTLRQIAKSKPDILILDVMMPGQSGFEVCEKIKSSDEWKDIKVIILTAKGQESDKEWAESVGADCFLSKPFSPLDLLNILKDMSAGKTAS